MFFVTLFTATTTINAQVQQLTANGKSDTANVSMYATGNDYATWYNTGAVPAGVSTAPTPAVVEQSKNGAMYAKKCLMNNIVRSNDKTHYFGAAIVTQTDLDNAFTKLPGTLSIANVNFKGHTVSEMVLTKDNSGTYGYMYDTSGHHRNFGTIPCVISTQGTQSFIFSDARCGQPFGTATMMMLTTGEAEIVGITPVVQPTPPTVTNPGGTNPNGGVFIGTGAPGGITLNINVTGNNNGGAGGNATGGSVGNTTATSTGGGNPNGAAAAGTTAGGFNFGFTPGSGLTTTGTAPGGTVTGVTTGTTTTTAGGTTVVNNAPNYKPQLNAIAAGTFLGPILGAGVSWGLNQIHIPGITVGGGTGTLPGTQGGLVKNPG